MGTKWFAAACLNLVALRSGGSSGYSGEAHDPSALVTGRGDLRDRPLPRDRSLAVQIKPRSTKHPNSARDIESLDKSLEDLLTRVDEFVGMLDMIRSDSSQVVNESIPQIYTKATEMRQIYRKIDKLEAFVKMIGNSVAGLEERVVKAETDLGAFPSTFKKILHTISIPSFLNKSSSSRQQQTLYEPPVLFKTEDYFPCLNEAPY
ncbi:PREDICTED: biogenesis of lysosome-related organelles complex 1 subunit 4-like [Nipponia nippon]|uniref:biogenesis of lysosome-related organelles complex 1 subunit 4-like n=1 Tax=Nipponia nippon TaxID=128390 RepID=UPI0005112D62|nr:PREDICTED: biogenesis of lysosome-related organelles complex 1 subunit 4-like [Nipponia nippon]